MRMSIWVCKLLSRKYNILALIEKDFSMNDVRYLLFFDDCVKFSLLLKKKKEIGRNSQKSALVVSMYLKSLKKTNCERNLVEL